jgi:hypothetical protein
MSSYGYSKAVAINTIYRLHILDQIEITEQGIYPKNLYLTEAVAHVLTFHPKGLPWKDAVRIANKKGYSSRQINEERPTNVFYSSEYIYLCGLGTFRNLIFLDVEKFDIPNIMKHLVNYFKKNKKTVLHLNDYYYKTKGQRCEIEYFTLRYLIKEYGEEYGLYFYGKAGVDNIGINPTFKHINQADVIMEVLNESKIAMIVPEIAARIKSKNIGQTYVYLNNLMEEGKIVRVDRMVFTTPKKAFSKIDTEAIIQVIQEIMNVSNVIVEADVFREYVNIELNLSYSKYYYAALVRTQLKEITLYRNNTLFSNNPIPYKSLFDLCNQRCDPELSINQNTKIIQEAVWLTDAVAANAVHRWTRQISH